MDPRDGLVWILIPLFALLHLSETYINTSPPLHTITAACGKPCISAALCTGCLPEGLWLPCHSLALSGLGLAQAPPGLLASLSTHPCLAAPTVILASSFQRKMKGERACTCACVHTRVWWASANFVPACLGLCLTVMIPLSHSNFSDSL